MQCFHFQKEIQVLNSVYSFYFVWKKIKEGKKQDEIWNWAKEVMLHQTVSFTICEVLSRKSTQCLAELSRNTLSEIYSKVPWAKSSLIKLCVFKLSACSIWYFTQDKKRISFGGWGVSTLGISQGHHITKALIHLDTCRPPPRILDLKDDNQVNEWHSVTAQKQENNFMDDVLRSVAGKDSFFLISIPCLWISLFYHQQNAACTTTHKSQKSNNPIYSII